MQTTCRQKIVKAIFELSGDELTDEILLNMCYETDEQLLDRLINIANWYTEKYN